MALRIRDSNQLENKTGSYFNRNFGTPIVTERTRYTGLVRHSEDVIGRYPMVNPLLLTSTLTELPVLNGERFITLNGVKTLDKAFYDCPIELTPIASSPDFYYPKLSVTQLNGYYWQAAAATNPSVPFISVPTYLGELKDIPGMIRDWGRFLLPRRGRKDPATLLEKWRDNPRFRAFILKRIAAGHLTWQWGIKPLIRDLADTLQFDLEVMKRLDWLNQLHKTKMLRRKVQFGSWVDTDPTVENVTVESALPFTVITARRDIVRTVKVWATIQWKTTVEFSYPTDSLERLRYAQRLTAGITGYESFATAWQLMPWSWLADWALNLQAILAAGNRSVGAAPVNCCVMRTVTSSVTYTAHKATGQAAEWVKISPTRHRAVRTTKVRELAFPVPLAPPIVELPILTGRQWSILGSLAILKG